MEFTAEQIANLVKGKVIGDPETKVSGFSQIEEGRKGNLSFLANAKYLPLMDNTEASVVIISENLIDKDKKYPSALIAVEDGYLAFQVLMNLYQDLQSKKTGIEQPAFVSESAKIMDDVYIGAFTYISHKSVIGEGSQIYPQVYIGKKILLNKRTRPPLKGYKRKRVDYVESNWMKYTGSNKESKKWKIEDCYREIIYICYNRTMMSYYETKLQFTENVLENDKFLNDNVLGKYYKTKIQKYIDDAENKNE